MKQFCLLTIFILFSLSSYSQATLGVRYTYQFEPNYSINYQSVNDEKFAIGLTSSLNLSKKLSLNYGLLYRSLKFESLLITDFEPEGAITYTSKAKKHQIEIPVHLRWYFSGQGKKFNPYIITGANVGLGFKAHSTFTVKTNSNVAVSDVNEESDAFDVFDYVNVELGTGFDYQLAEKFFFNFQFSAKGNNHEEFGLSPQLQFGFFYRFKSYNKE